MQEENKVLYKIFFSFKESFISLWIENLVTKNMKKTLLLFFTLLISCVAFSQNMSVSSFRYLENDLSGSYAKVEDINNQICALIKVSLPLSGVEFTGTGLESYEQKTGEYWVFVSPGMKFITIKHRDFHPIRSYAFPQQIKSARTYEMVVTIDKITPPTEEIITNQYLIIKSNTPEANIFVNDEYLGKQSVMKYLPLFQSHTYRVEAPLHHTKSGSLTLEVENKTTLQIDLDPAFGYLKVNTIPESGAEIQINGKSQSQITPFTSQKLESGKYEIRALKAMYKSAPQQVEIKDGQTTEITINLIPTFAQAEITCQDQDAEIYIDGTFRSKGSFKERLSEGVHLLEVKKQSHRTIKKNINVISGQPLKENITNLQAINGKLNISSTPFEADIYIDGKHYGQTPNIISQLIIGKHQIRLEKNGFKPLQETINIEEGKIAEYNFALQEKPKVPEYKLLQTLKADLHQVIKSIHYSPDSSRVVHFLYDNTVYILNPTNEEKLNFKGYSANNPNCSKIASGLDNGNIYIWDVNKEKVIKTLEGHLDCVNSIAYSPDGRKIISGSSDKTIKIWDANTGKCLKTLAEHLYVVWAVAYSPDGRKIISGSLDGTIKIWDANTGICLQTLNGNANSVNSVAYSPDGRKIISGLSNGTIKIWDANTGECLHTLEGHSNYVSSVSYTPDGSEIISGSADGTIKIWGVE